MAVVVCVHFLTGETVSFPPTKQPTSSPVEEVEEEAHSHDDLPSLQARVAALLHLPSARCVSLWLKYSAATSSSLVQATPESWALAQQCQQPQGVIWVWCVLRLAGGKGGFGSNLRSAGKRERMKATTNFDACRDLTGRRIRYVNQQRQLAAWEPGRAADPRQVCHELTKKELVAVNRAERRAEQQWQELERCKGLTAAELRQRKLEDAIAGVTQAQATIRESTQEALQLALGSTTTIPSTTSKKRSRFDVDLDDLDDTDDVGDDLPKAAAKVAASDKGPSSSKGRPPCLSLQVGLTVITDEDDDDDEEAAVVEIPPESLTHPPPS